MDVVFPLFDGNPNFFGYENERKIVVDENNPTYDLKVWLSLKQQVLTLQTS